MNKRPVTAKAPRDANKPKGSKPDMNNANLKSKSSSKPSSKPRSANPSNRNMGRKENTKPISKNKYTSITAAIAIQRNYRIYIKKLHSNPTYDLKQMLKKKKLGILQNYSIHIKENHYKETAKFGVFSNVKDINDHSYNKEGKIIEKKETLNQSDNSNIKNTFTQNLKKDQKTIVNNSNNSVNDNIKSILKKQYINEDLRGLTKQFCYEDDQYEINTDEFYMKIKEPTIDNEGIQKGKDNISKEEEDDDIKIDLNLLTKEEFNEMIPMNNDEISKTDNVYEKIYNEMKKSKNQKDHDNLQQLNNKEEDICNNNINIKDNSISKEISIINEGIKEIKKPISLLDRETMPNEEKSLIEDIQNKQHIDYNHWQNTAKKKTKPKVSNQDTAIETNNTLNEEKPSIHQNNSIQTLELKEANKVIESLNLFINDLKSQLKDKEDFIAATLLNQKGKETVMKDQADLTATESLEKTQRNECLITELKEKLSEMEKSTYKKLQTMRDNYDDELKKNKEAWFQAEKIKRKKWEEDKMKEIKDLTAKGLEPEIEKILSNHKIEIENIQDHCIKEIKNQRQRLIDEYDCKISSMKIQLNNEKDELIEYEKNQAVQRLKNQNIRLEEEINEERRRWNSKLENEIERLELLRDKDKQSYEDQINKLEERNNKNVFLNEDIHNKKIDEIKRNYDEKIAVEIFSLKQSIEKEHEKILESKKAILEAKYKEMRIDLIRDRDKQLNILIEKLGEDTIADKKKAEADYERKSNEKNITLIQENSILKKQLEEISDKLHAETKNRLNLEDSIDQLTKRNKEKEIALEKKENQLSTLSDSYYQLSAKFAGLTRDFNKEKMNLEIEVKTHLDKGEAEIRFLNNKLQTGHQLFEDQKKEIENSHKKEIIEIEAKLKKILKNRDDIIQKLQDDNQLKDVAILKYEEMLNKQRRDLLK